MALSTWWTRRMFCEPPVESESLRRIAGLMLILTVVAGGLLAPMCSAPLLEPDEGRHAEIAREMWRSGDWLAPQFLHQPYLDKPPMLYWLCSVWFELLGPTVFAARLTPAMASLLTVLGTFLLGRRLIGTNAAFLGGMFLAMSLGFVACGRFLILESLLTLFVVNALFCGCIATSGMSLAWRWWLASAVLCGLGVLTKGPVAIVLVVPPLVIYRWLNAFPRGGSVTSWLAYGVVVLATAGPWYARILAVRPEFARYFFWEHHVGRFLSGANHRQPLLFYMPVILLGCIPWTLLLFPAVRLLWDQRTHVRSLRPRGVGFLAIWAGWCLVFFTASAGKLPYYVLSCIPALALVAGWWTDRACSPFSTDFEVRERARGRFAFGAILLCGLGVLVGPVGVLLQISSVQEAVVESWACLIAGLTLWHVLPGWSARRTWLAFCAVSSVGMSEISLDLMDAWRERFAIVASTTVDAELLHDPRTKVVCVGGHWGSVPFVLDRDDVAMLESPTALKSGLPGTGPVVLLVDHDIRDQQLRDSLPPETHLALMARTDKMRMFEMTRQAGRGSAGEPPDSPWSAAASGQTAKR